MAADIAPQRYSHRFDVLFPEHKDNDESDTFWDAIPSATYAAHLQRASRLLGTTPPRRHRVTAPQATYASVRERRKTWSPASFDRANFVVVDNCASRSHEQLDEITETPAPPRITPVSGRLDPNNDTMLIRPIAFKPSGRDLPEYSPLSPLSPSSGHDDSTAPDDGYVSQDYPTSNSSGSWRSTADACQDLESLVRERDAELKQLRATLAANETAIVAVYEERRAAWHAERVEWQRRLWAERDRAACIQRALHAQIAQLKQRCEKSEGCDMDGLVLREHTRMCRENITRDSSRSSRQNDVTVDENVPPKTRDNESAHAWAKREHELTHEVEALRAQLQEACTELRTRTSELVAARNTLKSSESATVDDRLAEMEAKFAEERSQWQVEKAKVVRYQQRLQLNYVQMVQRNRRLEADLNQLTLELDGQGTPPSVNGDVKSRTSRPDESVC